MNHKTKTKLMMFADYGICLLLQFFGIFIISLIDSFSWGYFLYSILFSVVLFIFHYARSHNAGRRVDANPKKTTGLSLVAPLVIVHFAIIVLYALIKYNIIPIGSHIMKITYEFPDNAPRIANATVLMDYITFGVRIWFSTLIGFFGKDVSPFALLITPLLTLLAGFTGYLSGLKKFYISDAFAAFSKKIVDKFNE